jgi:hypothetical protein
MLARIKEMISPSNPFEKKLAESSLLSDNYSLVLDDLLYILDVFELKVQYPTLMQKPVVLIRMYFNFISKK